LPTRVRGPSLEIILGRKTFADSVEPQQLEDPNVVAHRVYKRFFGEDPIPFLTY
jgi:hypothetical protein